MRTVTATDANRNFSGLLRDVASGESILIVSRGTPVATMIPVDAKHAVTAAKETLLSRLAGQKATGERDWTRNELYGGLSRAHRIGYQHLGLCRRDRGQYPAGRFSRPYTNASTCPGRDSRAMSGGAVSRPDRQSTARRRIRARSGFGMGRRIRDSRQHMDGISISHGGGSEPQPASMGCLDSCCGRGATLPPASQ